MFGIKSGVIVEFFFCKARHCTLRIWSQVRDVQLFKVSRNATF